MTAQQMVAALNVTREFEATPAELFHAFTDPDALASWFGPPGTELLSSEADARVGGTYKFVLRHEEGVSTLHGEYVEVTAPRRLVFTWMIRDPEGPEGNQDLKTLVTVTFEPAENGKTLLAILHEALPTEASRQSHAGGWTGCLESLRAMMMGEGR